MIQGRFARAVAFVPSKLYELGVRTRIALYETGYLHAARLHSPVISVGNLTVGGTGKTPLVAFLARYLQSEGHEVAILSRGYQRTSHGLVEVSSEEGIVASAPDAGDEPFLLAASCPGVRVVVDSKRAAAGRWLESKAKVSVFLLDDGYQHLGLARDLNIALLDATDPLGAGAMVPIGRLREPLTSLSRADAVIVTRSDEPFDQNELRGIVTQYCRPGTTVFYAYHDVTGLRPLDGSTAKLSPMEFARQAVAAVSGIARPSRFIADLEHFGMRVVFSRSFADHHRYRLTEFAAVVRGAQAAGADAIVITEKDAINLPAGIQESSFLPIFVLEIAFKCEEEVALKSLVLRVASGGRVARN